jgi:hypothetical protein
MNELASKTKELKQVYQVYMETKTAITRPLSAPVKSLIPFTIKPASSMIKTFLIAIIVSVCSLQPVGVYAQITADASVNGKLRAIIENGKVKPGANGVCIAAGKVFNPVNEEYRVSRQPAEGDDGNKLANADEIKNLQSLIDSIKGGILGPAQLAADTKDKTKPTKRPERFKEVSKKTFPLLAKINKLSNPGALEEAEAVATTKKEDPPPGPLTGATFTLDIENVKTTVGKGAANSPMAVALAVVRDPFAVQWKKRSDREVTIDLSEVSLTAETMVSGTSAFALFGSDLSFINNKLNVHLDEDRAVPLYELLISLSSTNGEPDVLLETFDNEISDSLGNVGIDDVRDGLSSQLIQIGEGTFGFSSSYSFTVTVPGTPSKSVLFLRDFAVASVTAEGEPTPTPTPTPTPISTPTSTPGP